MNQHANIALKAGRSAWGMADRRSWASEGKLSEAETKRSYFLGPLG